MSEDLVEMGKAQTHWNVNGTKVLKYTVEIYHKGLNEHKNLSAPEFEMLQNKANLQQEKWTEKWSKLQLKKIKVQVKELNLEGAKTRSEEAQQELQGIDNLLLHTIDIDDTIDWNSLKSKKNFNAIHPKNTLQTRINKLEKPIKKPPKSKPRKPLANDGIFAPNLSLVDKLLSSRRKTKEKAAEEKFSAAKQEWEQKCKQVEEENYKIEQAHQVATATHNKQIEIVKAETIKQIAGWEKNNEIFLKKKAELNGKIDKMEAAYMEQNPESIVEYCEMVLNNSKYPDSFPQNFELEYNPDNKILIVEYELPPMEAFPNIKEVKYVASKDETKEVLVSEAQLRKMFDESMYKISLRSIHEVFEADTAEAIEAVSFNGWVKAVNKATGKTENNCILSLQAKKNEFIDIDLAKVDPKMCFKNLKGVASSKLSALTPVQPILQISKTDKRFTEGYDVVDGIDSTTNLAAMDWEDFEHLIRELFEKEFQSNGGEVKITQASRDGGVDAVAFDPDPIRGGKIVIQAKRYTNTVGVSAVRDLYGTVLNEGATKGIIVSTADYGPDAYSFAKGKPLTLLNGSNLLHLLEKHGHHAKIDIKEAKKIFAENQI